MSSDHRAEVIKEVGIFGLKTLLTLNSGAAIVLLAFVGNILGQSNPMLTIDVARLKCAMVWFLVGIGSAMVSILITYLLSQFEYAEHSLVRRLSPPNFLALMVVPAVLSFTFFCVGFVSAIFSIG